MNLGSREDRHVVGQEWRREQQPLLVGFEGFEWSTPRRAVDAHPRVVETPRFGATLRVAKIHERLAGEEATTNVGHLTFDFRLILGPPNPSGVNQEGAVLGVLEERVVEARVGGVGLGNDRRQIIGDEDREDPVEERPGGVESLDDVVGSLTVGEPHEHVATPHRHHDECVHHATSIGVGIEQHSHATEVGLQLLTWFTVGDAHRVVPGLGELLAAESLQGAIGNLHAASSEQVTDLGDGEIAIHPLLDLLFVCGEQLPRRAVFTSP